MKPGIAVVVPCYNLGRTIEAAIDSALEQTREVEEIIVIDDGSTDPYTRQILSQLRRPRTRIVRTDNRGLSRARNHGIGLCRTPYVVLLDADDLLHPTYVEQCAEYLDTDPELDFVCCGLQAFEGASYYWLPNAGIVAGIVKGSLHASTMFRKQVYVGVGGFDPDMPAFEASDFWICAMEKGFKGRILPEALLHYRIRWDSKYQQATLPEKFRAARTALLQKHAATIQQYLVEVIAATDAFLVEVGHHHNHLVAKSAQLKHESDALEREHAKIIRDLAARGDSGIDLGDFATPSPLGKPGDLSLRRYYTSRFVMVNRDAIRGVVLTDDPELCQWLGTATESIHEWNPESPGSAHADTVLLTDLPASPTELARTLESVRTALRTDGQLLAVVSATEHFESDEPQWRATEAAVRQALYQFFECDSVTTLAMGNVQVCVGALHGLSDEDLDANSLNSFDPWFPFLTGIRAVKKLLGAKTPIVRVGQTMAAAGRSRGAILMYHRVAQVESDARHLTLPPEHFRDHLDYLRQNYHVVSLEELARASSQGNIQHRSIAITLDDGYIDSLTAAAPLLSAYQLPATFFINSSDLDTVNEFWGDTVERIFLEESRLPARIQMPIGAQVIDLPTATAAERRIAWGTVSAFFYPLSALDRVRLLERVVAWSDLAVQPRDTHRRMVGKEVLELSRRPGHTIGAHTVNHLDLTAHHAVVQRHEMRENKRHLEQIIGAPVLAFSYPYGIHDAGIVSTARAVPFYCAVTVQAGLVYEGSDLLQLPRLEVPLKGVAEFREYLDGWFERGHPAKAPPV